MSSSKSQETAPNRHGDMSTAYAERQYLESRSGMDAFVDWPPEVGSLESLFATSKGLLFRYCDCVDLNVMPYRLQCRGYMLAAGPISYLPIGAEVCT